MRAQFVLRFNTLAARIFSGHAAKNRLTRENERERFEVFESESVRRNQDVTTNVPLRSGGMTVFIPVQSEMILTVLRDNRRALHPSRA